MPVSEIIRDFRAAMCAGRDPHGTLPVGAVANSSQVAISCKRIPDYALPSVTKHLIAGREFCVVS